MDFIRNTKAITRRELVSYFESPVAYVFTIVFLMLIGFLTFFVSNFYEAGQAICGPSSSGILGCF